MAGEVAYAASKGALASVTKTVADQLADQQITVNAVNPGPVGHRVRDARGPRGRAAPFPAASGGACPTTRPA